MNESNDNIEVNVDGLDALVKVLESAPRGRVGVLDTTHSDAEDATGSTKTNAQIGRIHEFGEGANPVRSFLRMPLTTLLSERLAEAGFMDEDQVKKLLQERSAESLMLMILALAESLVREAFATEGFGIWPKSNMQHKKVLLTLVETQQLRNAIASELGD